MLEAAVVLEAWVGVPAGGALDAGRRIVKRTTSARRPSRGVLDRAPRPEGLALEAIAFVASMIAIACWAAPLSDALGGRGSRERALLIALPLPSRCSGASTADTSAGREARFTLAAIRWRSALVAGAVDPRA